jgi:hypothetical protein
MTPERWRQIKYVLRAALELSPGQHAPRFSTELPNGPCAAPRSGVSPFIPRRGAFWLLQIDGDSYSRSGRE